MEASFETREIGPGIGYSKILDDRYKTNRITVNLIERLDRKTATENALIPEILKDSFRGCEDFTRLNRRLQDLYGADVRADVAKRGDSQLLSLSVAGVDDRFALDGERITWEIAQTLCDMLLAPTSQEGGFSPKYTALEKHALADTIDALLNEKRGYAISQMARAMCPDEPYGVPKYGDKEALASVTPQSAMRRYEQLLRRARVEAMFTGCNRAEAERVGELLERAFAPVGREWKDFSVAEPHSAAEKPLVEKTERLCVSQSKLVLGFASGLPRQSPVLPAMRLMAAVLGGTPSSKLFLNVRERLSLCYYCAASVDTYKGLLVVDCGVEEQNIDKAKAEILAQLGELQNGHVTDEELEHALLALQNAYSAVRESDAAIEAFYLGQRLDGQNRTPEVEQELFGHVTKQEVVEAARRLRLDTVYLLTGKEARN